MRKLLVAASPVEIEAKADEEGLSPPTVDIARQMFHELTDRLGRAAIALEVLHEDWPNHRFYFGTDGSEISALIDGLEVRPDIIDIAKDAANKSPVSGLYVVERRHPFVGVLVGHQNHEGMLSHDRG